MNFGLRRRLWVGLVLGGLVVAAVVFFPVLVPSAPNDNTLRVLFIGNSYTCVNNLPVLLKRVMASRNVLLATESVTPGGMTLEGHYKGGAAVKAIHHGRWDFVVLQEQSTRPFDDPPAMYKYAELLDAEVKEVHARTLLYETWAAKISPEEQPLLSAAYEATGRALSATVVPVGEGWKRVLPTGVALHGPDGRHPSLPGSYLAACIFARALGAENFGTQAEAIRRAGRPASDLSDHIARQLENAADDIVGSGPLPVEVK